MEGLGVDLLQRRCCGGLTRELPSLNSCRPRLGSCEVSLESRVGSESIVLGEPENSSDLDGVARSVRL